MLAFARAFGEFGATISFVSNIPGETRTLPIAIYELLNSPGGMPGVHRLAIVSLVVAFDGVDRRLEAAAETLGARAWTSAPSPATSSAVASAVRC